MDELFILKKETDIDVLDYFFPYDDIVSVEEVLKKFEELYEDFKRLKEDDYYEDVYEDIRLKEMEIYEENNR